MYEEPWDVCVRKDQTCCAVSNRFPLFAQHDTASQGMRTQKLLSSVSVPVFPPGNGRQYAQLAIRDRPFLCGSRVLRRPIHAATWMSSQGASTRSTAGRVSGLPNLEKMRTGDDVSFIPWALG